LDGFGHEKAYPGLLSGGKMLDPGELRRRITSFPSDYMWDFDMFWRRKLEIEAGEGHILDDNHRGETYVMLRGILRRWQAFRPFDTVRCLSMLKRALLNISSAYDEIREYELLRFSDIPLEPLELIWDELGVVKHGGVRHPRKRYYVISICKPLMLLWGQTLAFDERVRRNLPPEYRAPRGRTWDFWTWRRVMVRIQEDLKSSPGFLRAIREEAERAYGRGHIIPYGRFLDIYYWVP